MKSSVYVWIYGVNSETYSSVFTLFLFFNLWLWIYTVDVFRIYFILNVTTKNRNLW